ncbi:MAG: flagellar protein FlaG [Limnohabitans sp.]|nr:flagellar protein FlaG [Limnohabitans sp.]
MINSIQPISSTPPQVTLRPSPSIPVAAASHTAPAKSEVPVDMERMKQNLEVTIGRLNEQMRDGGRNVTFAMDEALGRPIVVVRNEDTGEVIRQIPNEAVVKVAHNIEALKGLLLNKKI